jgi:hypothetical protein
MRAIHFRQLEAGSRQLGLARAASRWLDSKISTINFRQLEVQLQLELPHGGSVAPPKNATGIRTSSRQLGLARAASRWLDSKISTINFRQLEVQLQLELPRGGSVAPPKNAKLIPASSRPSPSCLEVAAHIAIPCQLPQRLIKNWNFTLHSSVLIQNAPRAVIWV